MSYQGNRTALLGKKLGMSQVWDENGFFVPVTLVDVSTNVVTAVKTRGDRRLQGRPAWLRPDRPDEGHQAAGWSLRQGRCDPAPSPSLRCARTMWTSSSPAKELTAELSSPRACRST